MGIRKYLTEGVSGTGKTLNKLDKTLTDIAEFKNHSKPILRSL
jgi:hypothetical protein